MTASRLEPLDPPFDPAIATELERIMPAGVDPLKLFRTLAHNPRVLLRVFAGGLLDRGSIDLRDREIVILRTCARCGAAYEWGVHVSFFAEKAGFTEAEVAATVLGQADDPAWSARDGALVRLVDELHDTSRIGDDLWQALRQHWDAAQLVELVVLTGFYHSISFATNALGVELESYGARFPNAA